MLYALRLWWWHQNLDQAKAIFDISGNLANTASAAAAAVAALTADITDISKAGTDAAALDVTISTPGDLEAGVLAAQTVLLTIVQPVVFAHVPLYLRDPAIWSGVGLLGEALNAVGVDFAPFAGFPNS